MENLSSLGKNLIKDNIITGQELKSDRLFNQAAELKLTMT